ncbi:hypothetical protein B0J13DRAFT_143346 [Dactylonectria estremocensis]|uniref:CBM-cenC domain-containing protein n=1 Tax=Dactylonectria estremocensis TaxID=1079267 RepID=A0A9P9E125_9HYPO|nr:hypothetical protein B0J13DRAFT_143346 [Dactylonectria estremocensis]
MRWISLCTILGVALLPAVSARPLCHPDYSTSLTTPTTTPTSTPDASSTTPAPQTPTPDVSTTPAVQTPTPTPVTPTQPEPTLENLLLNGDFEEDDVSVWGLRTVTIQDDAAKAHSPSHYVRYEIDNESASGGNHLNQTISGLDVTRWYRLTFSAAVFGSPMLGDATCSLEALQDDVIIESWQIDPTVLNRYSSYDTEFLLFDSDITLALRLRCTSENLVTLTIGVDDMVLNDIGPARS